jgi:hypothetical protein
LSLMRAKHLVYFVVVVQLLLSDRGRTHLVVHERKPISDPEDEGAAGPSALVHVHGLKHALKQGR